MASSTEEVQSLKDQGNDCYKQGKYEEAVLLYSQAIQKDPKNSSLFSNRSAAFLKIQQHYHALEDAQETIRLRPDWAKGYFRKGDVEAATYNFTEALLSYRCALELQPNDQTVLEAISRTTKNFKEEKRANEQVPWVGAGIGIVIGVTIVIADQTLAASPSVTHPILMAFLTMAIAAIGFGLARAYRYYVDCQRKGLLDPPFDILKEMTGKDDDSQIPTTEKVVNGHQRLSKAQARFKLRKGKS